MREIMNQKPKVLAGVLIGSLVTAGVLYFVDAGIERVAPRNFHQGGVAEMSFSAPVAAMAGIAAPQADMQNSNAPMMRKSLSVEASFDQASPAPDDAAPQGPLRKVEERYELVISADNEDVARIHGEISQNCRMDCQITGAYLNTSGHVASANITLRLGKRDDYVAAVLGLFEGEGAKVSSSSRSSIDHTMNYVDISSRKETQIILKRRLEAMLESNRVENLRAALEVERELSRVIQDIEAREAQLRHLDAVSDMTTVNVRLEGRTVYAPSERANPVIEALNDARHLFLAGVATVIRKIAQLTPGLIAVGGFVLIGWLGYRGVNAVRRMVRRPE